MSSPQATPSNPRSHLLGALARFLLLSVPLTLGGAIPTLAVDAPSKSPDRTLSIQSLELLDVNLDPPVRVGRGADAVWHSRALEIRLTTAPFREGSAAVKLRVGDRQLAGHRTVRSATAYTLAFHVFDPETLPEGGCLQLGYAPQTVTDCTFRFNTSQIVSGQALVEASPRSFGTPPDPSLWNQPVEDATCSNDPGGVVGPPIYKDIEYILYDPQDRPIQALQPGDTLAIELRNLPPRRQIQLHVVDDRGREWSYARLSANAEGRIPRTVLWYNTGVIGTTSRRLLHRPDPSFLTFDEAAQHWAANALYLELRTEDGGFIQRQPLPMTSQRTTPLLYPSNAQGILMNSMEAQGDAFYVSGTHYPAGATVALFVVDNRYAWQDGTPFHDVSGRGGASEVTLVQLAPGETRFTAEVWPRDRMRPGRYDLISRILPPGSDAAELDRQIIELAPTDVVSFGTDTAVVLYEVINGHIVVEMAGRAIDDIHWSQAAWFEFADVFERGQDVFGAVDPTDVPLDHPGGEYAAYYVVEKQSADYWDETSSPPALVDISGPGGSSQPEVAQVKYSCINLTRTPIWPDAQPAGACNEVHEYQVIVEFGANPASSSDDYETDGAYDKGTDFIDRYPEAGFSVVDDPAGCCLFPVGQRDFYSDTADGTDPNGAFTFPHLEFPDPVRNWFTIRYPAAGSGGMDADLPAGTDRYPIVLVLHGRHPICAVGLAFDPNCAPDNWIPSHRGHDYLLDVLAKRGYVAISIDAFDLQFSESSTNIEARAELILDHLIRMRSWDSEGTDPWNGFFQDRLDLDRIALVGHSRGGEAVVAAQQLNDENAYPSDYGFGVQAVIAIAPSTDHGLPEFPSWDVVSTPYLSLIGSADGDLVLLDGFHIYDRAYPSDAEMPFEKSLAWIYGANHNFFNTVWTPSFGIDPYAFDDGETFPGPRISEEQQRSTALRTVLPFILQHLEGIEPYRQVFTGQLPLAGLPNESIHWSYQHPDRLTLDDFENGNNTLNTLNDAVSFSGDVTVAEDDFGLCSGHNPDNSGGVVTWSSDESLYVSELPLAQQDVSAYTHLSLRVTQIPDDGNLNPVGEDQEVLVRLVDTDGDARWVLTSEFQPIPYPYDRGPNWEAPCQMKSVRLPLRNFTMNNSGIDLDRIDRVEIVLPDQGKLGIDDLHFTH